MAFGEGEESPTDHSRQGGFGRGMRIATGAERPRNDRSRKNLRVIPRPVRRLVVGSEPSAASGRGSEVSEWPRSKFPASAVRQRRNFGHRNRVIRNTPAQRSRRTDCHSQCAHWLRNDIFLQGVRWVSLWCVGAGQSPAPTDGYKGCNGRATARVAPTEMLVEASAPTEALQEVQWAGDRKGRPYGGLRGMCGLGIGPCGSFFTGREWYVSDFSGGG